MHIFVENLSGASVIVTGEDAHHLVAVRRVHKGEVFSLIEKNGENWALGRIIQVAKHDVELAIESRHLKPAKPLPRFFLYPALLKRSAMEMVLQRSVELGVDAICPILASRSIPDSVNQKRWETIVREAAMQSHRYDIPIVEKPGRINDLQTTIAEPLIVLTTQVTGLDLKSWVESQPKIPASIGVLIGPEGGWTADEEGLFLQKGLGLVSFGASIMRADTANVGVLSALRYAYHTLS
jgi:16S rRNA (uracil1498-N3)-methyltransferase